MGQVVILLTNFLFFCLCLPPPLSVWHTPHQQDLSRPRTKLAPRPSPARPTLADSKIVVGSERLLLLLLLLLMMMMRGHVKKKDRSAGMEAKPLGALLSSKLRFLFLLLVLGGALLLPPKTSAATAFADEDDHDILCRDMRAMLEGSVGQKHRDRDDLSAPPSTPLSMMAADLGAIHARYCRPSTESLSGSSVHAVPSPSTPLEPIESWDSTEDPPADAHEGAVDTTEAHHRTALEQQPKLHAQGRPSMSSPLCQRSRTRATRPHTDTQRMDRHKASSQSVVDAEFDESRARPNGGSAYTAWSDARHPTVAHTPYPDSFPELMPAFPARKPLRGGNRQPHGQHARGKEEDEEENPAEDEGYKRSSAVGWGEGAPQTQPLMRARGEDVPPVRVRRAESEEDGCLLSAFLGGDNSCVFNEGDASLVIDHAELADAEKDMIDAYLHSATAAPLESVHIMVTTDVAWELGSTFHWLMVTLPATRAEPWSASVTSMTIRGTGNRISGGFFRHFARLQMLDISVLDEIALSPTAFQDLVSLTHLAITESPLADLPDDVFQGTPNVTHLVLSKTRLQHLPSRVFQPLTRLLELRLTDNDLTAIQGNLFPTNSSLVTLDASRNRVSIVARTTMLLLENLLYLRLDNNAISIIPDNTLQSQTRLLELRLRRNSLILIQDTAFDTLTRIERLDLLGNSLSMLPTAWLKNARRLKVLDVAENSITAVDPDAFATNTALTSVSFRANELLNLPELVLAPLAELSFFSATDNVLSSLPARFFEANTKLRFLHLDFNSITGLHPTQFQNLRNLTQLMLASNDIRTIPDGVFDTLTQLTVLRLADNYLTALPSTALAAATRLGQLAIDRNELVSLHRDLLSSATALRELWIDGNDLESLPPGLFRSQSQLQQLTLNNNRLTVLPADVFAPLSRVGLIWLHRNRLERLPRGLFQHTTNLQELELWGNRLTEMPQGLFQALSNLFQVNLAHNRLTRLDGDLFAATTSLTWLQFQQNQLQALPEQLLATTPVLAHFSCSSNALTAIAATFFDNVPLLRELYLHNNRLEALPASIFDGVGGLRLLSLHQNRLQDLPEGLLQKLPELTQLSLHENNFFHPLDHAFRNSNHSLVSLTIGFAPDFPPPMSIIDICDLLAPRARVLSLSPTPFEFAHSCLLGVEHFSIHHSPHLESVVSGATVSLNVSTNPRLERVQAISASILDISFTSIPPLATICSTIGTRMLFARGLASGAFMSIPEEAGLLISRCLARVNVLDLSENAWLNNLDVITYISSQSFVLDTEEALMGGRLGIVDLNDFIPVRQSVPTVLLLNTPIACGVSVRTANTPAGDQQQVFSFVCGCSLGFQESGNACLAPETSVAGVVVGTIFGTLALVACVVAAVVYLRRLYAYRVKLESDNELTRKLLDMEKEEVSALKSASIIGYEELVLLDRIDRDSPGTFGEVWSVQWDTLTVAVKFLKLALMELDESIVDEFDREVDFLRRTRHPNLVRFFGTGRDPNGAPFLVLELVEHGALNNLLRKGLQCLLETAQQAALSGSTASLSGARGVAAIESVKELKLRLCVDIAKGMAFLHNQGILHRDLKCGNVLISSSLHAKITDFGSVRDCIQRGIAAATEAVALEKASKRRRHKVGSSSSVAPSNSTSTGTSTSTSASRSSSSRTPTSGDHASHANRNKSGSASLLNSEQSGERGPIASRDASSSMLSSGMIASTMLGLEGSADGQLLLYEDGGAEQSLTVGVGTPLYMAPEILSQSKRYSTKADVFSFGVTLWSVMTERRPDLIEQEVGNSFRGSVVQCLLTLLHSGRRLAFLDEDLDAAPWCRSLAEKCMAYDERDRPDFAAITATLEAHSASKTRTPRGRESAGDAVEI